MPFRIERFSSTLKHCVGDILLNEINNPRLKLITILEVNVSKDLKKARIYVSSTNTDYDDFLVQLNKTKGLIKKLLAKKMYLKYVPEITFISGPFLDMEQKIRN
jgi:ribosome-binding factor A